MKLIETEFQVSDKELVQAFPELYAKYKKIYGTKRPKINVDVKTEYSFHPSVTDSRSDFFVSIVYFFYQDGDVAYFDTTIDGGEGNFPSGKYKLGNEDAVLECHTGQYQYCTLIVNPSFINQKALPEAPDLNPAEQYVLLIYRTYKSTFRKSNFLSYTFSGKYSLGSEFMYDVKSMNELIKDEYSSDRDEAYDMIVEDLVHKGLITPSNRLTADGTNVALYLANHGEHRQFK